MADETSRRRERRSSWHDLLRGRLDRPVGAGGPSHESHEAIPIDSANTGKPLRARVAPRDATQVVDLPDMVRAVATVATTLWKVRSRVERERGEQSFEVPKWLQRQLEASSDELEALGVELKDHTGEKYVAGLALGVMAFQPRAGITFDVIVETIKPSVYLKGALIQPGEVIVATPETVAGAS